MQRLALLTAVAVLSALAASVEPARACSCALGDPRAALGRADGALIGTFVEKLVPGRPTSSAAPAVYVFRVLEAVKGRFGRTVEVISALSGASCGLEVRRGQMVGLLLDRRGGRWESSLCQQVEPARLRAAARPLPAPDGRGAVAFLVGGRFGPMSTLALDAAGRTLAYGRGPDDVLGISVCPGARRAVEVAVGDSVRLVVRTLPQLRLVRRPRLPLRARVSASVDVRCLTRGGESVVVFWSDLNARGAGARLLRVRRGRARTVWRGRAPFGAVDGREAHLALGARGDRLGTVSLATRRLVVGPRIRPTFSGIAVSPDGRLVAAASRARITLVAPAGSLRRVRAVRVSVLQDGGRPVWTSANRLAVPTPTAVRVYDARLRLVARATWSRGLSALGSRAERLYGLDWSGSLVRVPLTGGRARRVRELPGTVARVLVAVPAR